jgi:hypothetical protein
MAQIRKRGPSQYQARVRIKDYPEAVSAHTVPMAPLKLRTTLSPLKRLPRSPNFLYKERRAVAFLCHGSSYRLMNCTTLSVDRS